MLQSNLKNLKLLGRGKVRDLYEIDENHILFVCTDRLSAFDVILAEPIPEKGRILTQISQFWFDFVSDLIPTHLSLADKKVTLESLPLSPEEVEQLKGRSMIVRKVKTLPVEVIVRGYLVGSGWKDYQKDGKVCGIQLPPGLKNGSKLPQAIFTPSTKAEVGQHDLNITREIAIDLIGDKEIADQVEKIAVEIYTRAAEYAEKRGILIADTKMEFGVVEEEVEGEGEKGEKGEKRKRKRLVLIDEVLTPDSSRFWPLDQYQQGEKEGKWGHAVAGSGSGSGSGSINPPSLDKQPIRDYLESISWNKKPPPPPLPPHIAKQTTELYTKALQSLTSPL
eukprot:TRINITY_DN2043_c0_g2_i1.p1 TRINITY_DN2043_c0_g2~~TRINITY_DN2043_c0_g2_i1.p1  ORF type:complete len:358 (-),score=116.04 TRINITY_DN2043_c0_g2_i1:173-1180(-)